MKIGPNNAAETAKELTLSAIEHNMIQVYSDDKPEEVAEKVLAFYNTIADSLNREN